MNRLTSNDKDYIFASLNLFYVKDMEVWLRGGGPEPNYDDTTLVELIRRASKTHNLNIEAEDAESLGDEMYDAMFDGVDTVEGIVALLHTAAIQAAEMRNRLAAYEDTGLEPEEIAKIREDVETGYLKSTARRYGIPVDRLRELAQADREGRCVVQRFSPGQVVWAVERNEDGEAVDFYGYVFVTSLRGVALVSPKINGSSEIDVILMDQVESRISSSGGSIEAYPIDDCYLTREEAEKALKGEGHETDPV